MIVSYLIVTMHLQWVILQDPHRAEGRSLARVHFAIRCAYLPVTNDNGALVTTSYTNTMMLRMVTQTLLRVQLVSMHLFCKARNGRSS